MVILHYHHFKNLRILGLVRILPQVLQKDKNLPKSDLDFNNYLIDLFDKGPWSEYLKNLSHLILNKNYKNFR